MALSSTIRVSTAANAEQPERLVIYLRIGFSAGDVLVADQRCEIRQQRLFPSSLHAAPDEFDATASL